MFFHVVKNLKRKNDYRVISSPVGMEWNYYVGRDIAESLAYFDSEQEANEKLEAIMKEDFIDDDYLPASFFDLPF